jgi:hypothetical protein
VRANPSLQAVIRKGQEDIITHLRGTVNARTYPVHDVVKFMIRFLASTLSIVDGGERRVRRAPCGVLRRRNARPYL